MTRFVGLCGGFALVLSLAWMPASQIAGGRISGVAIADGGPRDGEPLTGVTVTLTNGVQAENMSTDERGEFAFTGLAPGRYRIATRTRQNYAGQEVGAFHSGGEGTAVEIEHARSAVHVMAHLRYFTTIRGTVMTEDGTPAANVRILPRPSGVIHPDAPHAANEAITDIRGEFTAVGAYRGEMVITAIDDTRMRPARNVTYFPGTADPGRAERLTIRTGEERELPPMKLAALDARVAGIVTLADGNPAPGAHITVQNRFDKIAEAVTDPAGRFDVPVASGSYDVIATYPGRPTGMPDQFPLLPLPAFWTSARIDAASSRKTRTTLALQPVPSFSGRITTDDQNVPVTDVTIELRRRGTLIASVRSQGDKFEFERVIPGEYGITVRTGQENQWWVKSLTVDGRSLFAHSLSFKPGERLAHVVLALSRDRGDVNGVLTGRDDLPQTEFWVALIPTDESVWQPESTQFLRTRPATNGRFLFERAPAGEYALAVFGDLGLGEWRTPDVLKPLVASGIKVTVRAGSTVRQNVQVQR